MDLMRRVLVILLLVGCGPTPSARGDLPHATQHIKLPEFVNEPDYNNNANIAAPSQELILFRNLDAIKEIVKHDSAVVDDEMLRRLSPSYQGLTALGDDSLVPSIQAALPGLRSYTRAEAELAIVHLQGGDKIPALLQLLERKDFLLRDDVVWVLKELRDPRSVAAMTSTLCYDRYRVDIAMALQEITGQNFGTDQKRWTLWLDQEKPF